MVRTIQRGILTSNLDVEPETLSLEVAGASWGPMEACPGSWAGFCDVNWGTRKAECMTYHQHRTLHNVTHTRMHTWHRYLHTTSGTFLYLQVEGRAPTRCARTNILGFQASCLPL